MGSSGSTPSLRNNSGEEELSVNGSYNNGTNSYLSKKTPRDNIDDKDERQKTRSQKKKAQSKDTDNFDMSAFPTPTLLAEAQRRYNNSQRGNRKLDPDGIPLPFPPPTRKSEIFNAADFKNIDRLAQKAPLELADKGYTQLVSYLTEPAVNDIGKVRSFFVWIASQRLQEVLDYVGNNMPGSDKPLFVVLLTLVKQWGNGYSELFSNLCKAANIPCRIVKGRAKGSGYRLGEKTRGTNDYCMVYVDGAWRFVDQHWGSQFVMGAVENDEWELAQNKENTKESNEKISAGGWDYICDDFYFLTDPEALVYTHLAVDPANQLLARPVTEEEYWQMAYLKDAFFELEMTSVSHPKCVVQSDDGIVVFEFGLSRTKHCAFSYAMYKSAKDPSLNLINGVSLDQYVMMEKVGVDILRISIHFPRIGRYKFNLYGRDLDSKIGFTAVCEYAIECNQPDFSSDPYPENILGEWGPGGQVSKLDIQPQTTNGGIIYAKDGMASVHWTVNGIRKLVFQNRLKSATDPKEDLKACIRHSRTNNQATFRMKLPHQGRYVLQLFVKDVDKDRKFRSVCNYLVIADVGCSDTPSYPPCDNKFSQTGDLSQIDDVIIDPAGGTSYLVPISHKEPIIDPYESGDISIRMSGSQLQSPLQARLHRYYEKEQGEGQTEDDCGQHVLLHQNGDNVDVSAQFPQVGFYKLDILSPSNTPLYQYLINVPAPNIKASPFPEQGESWKPENELIEPRSGLLQTNTRVHMRIDVPDATKVKVVGQSTTTNLSRKKKNSSVWEGDVITEPDDGTLNVIAENQDGNVNQLLAYKVLNPDGARKEIEKQEAAQQEAEQYQRELQRQKSTMADARKKKDEEAGEKARMAAEDFRKNERMYRTQEQMIQQKVEEEEEEEDSNTDDQMESEAHETENLKNTADQKAALMAMIQMRNKQLVNHKPLYKVDGRDGWKKYHPQLSQKMALEKLRESIRCRNVTMLKGSIADCQDYGMTEHKEVKNASNIVTVFDARRRLDEAYDNRDKEALQAEIDYIRQTGLAKQMPNELREAMYHLETLERASHLHDGIMDMDKRTMSEVRRYQNPPPMMHKVVQGSFLLLGDDEETTENWKDCQRLLNPQGLNGLNRRIIDFQASDVHPEIVARSKEILSGVDIAKVRSVCPAAGTFYVWAMGVIEENEVTNDNKGKKIPPANLERQKEILRRRQADDQEDQGLDRDHYKSLAINTYGSPEKHNSYRSPRRDGGGSDHGHNTRREHVHNCGRDHGLNNQGDDCGICGAEHAKFRF